MGNKKSIIYKISSFILILIIGVFGMKMLGSSKKQTNKRDVVQEEEKLKLNYYHTAMFKLRLMEMGLLKRKRRSI